MTLRPGGETSEAGRLEANWSNRGSGQREAAFKENGVCRELLEVGDKGIGTGELVGRVRTGEEERQEHETLQGDGRVSNPEL